MIVKLTQKDDPNIAESVTVVSRAWSEPLKRYIKPLASLKLTVALFAMSICIVVAGTFAQIDKDIWEVIGEYFRIDHNKLLRPGFPGFNFGEVFVKIDFQLFFPASFFPSKPRVPGHFYFPKGWLIGLFMAMNLVTAHLLRFKVQANGARLWAGGGVIALGCLVTWLVIDSGSNKEDVQEATLMEWATLWSLLKWGLGALWLAMGSALLRLEPKRSAERWMVISVVIGLGGLLCWLFYKGDAVQLDDSSMRILWQLIKGMLAGLILLGGSVMVFKKRAGVVVLHAGVGLMMFSELLVGTTAVEGQMQIKEGDTVNFVQDIRKIELALIDSIDANEDDVVVIPESILLAGRLVKLPYDDVPLSVEVVKFMKNSKLRLTTPDEKNIATDGAGLQRIAVPIRSGTGTDVGGGVDRSSIYVTFRNMDDGQVISTRLLSLWLEPETIDIDGKTYQVSLRFKRNYKPYSVHLIDVSKDDYLGTDTPRNYSSKVRLVDTDRGVDRKISIWMNNPLRFAGETFYQSTFVPAGQAGVEMTGLQVVTNTGWMIPYVSCMIVATGMLAHFWTILLRFLNRRASGDLIRARSVEIGKANQREKDTRTQKGIQDRDTQGSSAMLATHLFPVVLVVIFSVWLAGKTRVPIAADNEMDLYAFCKLPLVYQGRVKPIDTMARNSLRIISGMQTYVDDQGIKQPAIRWLLDVIVRPQVSFQHEVFRIEHLELLETLDLERRKGFRYAFQEFGGKLSVLKKQAELARSIDSSALSLYQKKVLELEKKIGVLDVLIQSFSAPNIRRAHVKEDLIQAILQQQELAKGHPPLAIPPQSESKNEKWETFAAAWTRDLVQTSFSGQEPNSATESMSNILVAYAQQDIEEFNSEVTKYHNELESNPPVMLNATKTNFEVYFNHLEPFYHSTVLYVFAFLLAAGAWLGWSRPLNLASFWLLVFTLAVHTTALIARIYISGRPPVTNLYSSAVFIGWGCVVLALILEVIYRMGIGNIVASVAGFITLVIAHFLAGDGDTFTVLQAVLDTQFWLATHVVCITLGYATTYITGLLGAIYILRGIATPTLTFEVSKQLTRMIYGTLCFAIFFSFVGTVLGGLWADDSWGRFWGWDPKENGALIIVLWNALVLHARWGGMVKERGLAVLAVGGNIVTSWSWFGVNELGVGLHSYGFTEGVLLALGIFVLTQLAIIMAGVIPKNLWLSFKEQQNAESAKA